MPLVNPPCDAIDDSSFHQLATLMPYKAESIYTKVSSAGESKGRNDRAGPCVHRLFEMQVKRTPDAVAVVFEGRSLTYNELNTRSNQLAHYLQSVGVGPDDLVGLFVERSLEMTVALLGILKAGGAYVPLDPGLPAARLGFMMDEVNPGVVITLSSLVSRLPSHASQAFLLDVDEDCPILAAMANSNPVSDCGQSNLAYVMYTSGSTGIPKAVLIEHGNLANYTKGIIERLILVPGLNYAMISTIAADLGHTVLFPSLVTGGELHLISKHVMSKPDKLADYFRREWIDVLKIVPSHLRALLQAASPGNAATLIPHAVLVLGGEASDWKLIDRVRTLAPNCGIFNHYGPTETTVGVLLHDLQVQASKPEPKSIPLGKPLLNSSVCIVNPDFVPCDVGVPGELLIGGAGVARGYLNRPEETAERFISDPFLNEPNARFYRSGDRARWLPDGTIEFLGRLDHQVKIRGYRIELGEIESALAGHVEVEQALVLVREDGTVGKSLAAFVVGRGDAELVDVRFRTFLEGKLPDYMIPSSFTSVKVFPLSPNGKVDRQALLHMLESELETDDSCFVPTNHREEVLVGIWRQVMGREDLGIRENFFDVGGNSLMAIAICAHISRNFGLEIPLRWLFEYPTIETLADQMDRMDGELKNVQPMRLADRTKPLPMSPSQQGMWLLHQLLPDQSTYNQPVSCQFSGEINVDLYKQALMTIQQRHETLRTALVQADDRLVQQIFQPEDVALPWTYIDLQELKPTERQTALARILSDEAREPFILAQAPLWRVVWIQLAADEQVMALNFHHSITDEWSKRVFLSEFQTILAGIAEGKITGLSDLQAHYADYACWQIERLSGELLERQRAYWSLQLADLPSRIELTEGMARPDGANGRGAVHDFKLTTPLVVRLRSLARDEGMSLFTILLAGFQVWLYRQSGENDIVVGTPVALRERPEVQSMIGFFMNTLPIRVRLHGNSSFRELLGLVHGSLLEAFSNVDLPFEKMVEIATKIRAPDHQPLYQVMFVLVEERLPGLCLNGVESRFLPIETRTTKSDLTLRIEAVGDDWACQFEHSTDLFCPETIALLSRHLVETLNSITANVNQPIGRLNILAEDERHRVLVEWNRTERLYPRGQCIHQLFDEQARQCPDAVALESGEMRMTYGELNQSSTHIAQQLCLNGVNVGAVVGLSIERSFLRVVALLGILKAGAAYWAIEENLPESRIRSLIEDAQPALILCCRNSTVDFSDLVSICSVEELLEASWVAADFGQCVSHVDAPAYISYTSGSTGQPKGVVIPHRGVVRLVKGTDYVSLTPIETLLHLSPLSFDASTFELWGALLNGARVVLMPPGQASLEDIGCAIRQHRVTTLWLTAGLFHLMVDERLDDLKPLRQLLAGGDVLSPSHVAKARSALTDCRIVNGYGPTENTTFTCCYTVTDDSELMKGVPIGRPIANTRVYILDENLQPVPVGVAGELYAGGDGVACGYLNKPELTAERFIPDPFSLKSGDRVYRTGDRVRWRHDGNIEFLGRLDHQVKIRGFRIELGEIEVALGSHPQVSGCAVIAQLRNIGDYFLTGFVVADIHDAPSTDCLLAWLKGKLPDYMIPLRIVALSALPLTRNGKLDRKALETASGDAFSSQSEYVAPRDVQEEALVEIWQKVLCRERIGVRDNFFALGGHSLLAAMMCSQISRRFGIALSLRSVFEHPTIELASRQMASDEIAEQQAPSIKKADRCHYLPMSFAQQGMWLLQQILPDPAAYNQPVAWRLSGKVDGDRIKQCLRIMMDRHEVLRTALSSHGGNLIQVVLSCDEMQVPWQEIDVSTGGSQHKDGILEELLLAESRRPIDLSLAPLWRVSWIKTGVDEHVLALIFHHSIIDEWSLRLLSHELMRIYAVEGHAELAGLPELPVQYADYAVWQRQRLSGESYEKQCRFWREQLRDLPAALEMPADRDRPVRRDGRGACHNFSIPPEVVAGCRILAGQEGTTVFTVMLAAFQVWLYRYSGQTDFVVGTPVANRDRPEVQSLLGFFLNTLPIRARLDQTSGFRVVIQQLRETVMAALDHADLPFEQLVVLTDGKREDGNSPVYQVMFVLLEEGLPCMRLGQAHAQQIPMTTGTSKNDLILSIHATAFGCQCALEYATDMFSMERAADMARHFNEMLLSITDDPEMPVGRLNMLAEDERHRILVEWNRTKREYSRDQCIHQLFDEQARKYPDAVAVELGEMRMTYGELSQSSNLIAQQLCLRGVNVGAVIGLNIERSFLRVIALLGVLKAGAAYWAMEENLPESRLRSLIEDAQPALILCTGKSTADFSDLVSSCAVEELLESPGAAADFVQCVSHAGDPAYISYTSGSTGQPKGVVIPHRGVVRLVKGTDYVSLTPQETLLHMSPLSFDASTFELWGGLLNGARVVLMPPGQATLGDIGTAIRQYRVTTLWLTAGLFHLMVDERLDDLKPLRQLLAGGDVLSPAHVAKARRALSGCRIVNGYGPTENTTFTCCYTVTDDSEFMKGVPIGRPIANTRVYILDDNLQPVPVGVAGELYAGGDGVACGYLNNPELTAERFIPDPFSSKSDDRVYRTGDRVRWRHDGNIEFLGRQDHQVKIRGFRVELGAIEFSLCCIPDIREAVVIPLQGLNAEIRLVAYLVGAENAAVAFDVICQQLRTRLPEYMIPSAFVLLDCLPLTPNGKLDRHHLPAPDQDCPKETDESGQAKNLLELELIRIWEMLLHRSGIGRNDNFFDLGGHSLQAVRLSDEIEKLLGSRHSIASLFQSPTIASFSRRLTDENWAPAWSSLVPLQPLGSKPPIFFIHGMGGDVFVFLELARLLGDDQPSYGIQALGIDGKSAQQDSITSMACHYAREITSFYPDGPYQLAGYSLGGIIAFETAQELRRIGREVELLALFDTEPLRVSRCAFYGLFVPERCLFHFMRWVKMPITKRLSYIQKRWSAFRLRLVWNDPAQVSADVYERVDVEHSSTPGFLESSLLVARSYHMRRYPGNLDIFTADDANTRWRWFWRFIAVGGVSFHRIKGNHGQILDAGFVPTLARSLTARLARKAEMGFNKFSSK